MMMIAFLVEFIDTRRNPLPLLLTRLLKQQQQQRRILFCEFLFFSFFSSADLRTNLTDLITEENFLHGRRARRVNYRC